MPTHRQHFVPKTYLSAWETTVERKAEPSKKFSGVYSFNGEEKIGDGTNIKSILWKQGLYTIGFNQLFISQSCPLVYKDFVDQVFELMNNRSPNAVYGKLGYSVIKTRNSVRKHLKDIDEWDFYYYDGNIARKKSIISDIYSLNSYILEDGLDAEFEREWKSTLDAFVLAMKNPSYGIEMDSVRVIPERIVEKVFAFFFMMLCRNPQFGGMGIYTWIRDELLAPAFGSQTDSFMEGIWYSELYRMLFKRNGGHFHSLMKEAMERCQLIFYETYDNAGSFITSDNPAYQIASPVVEIEHMRGFVFPLSPKYLIFICKGSDGYNNVDYRKADNKTVRYFNRATYSNRTHTVVASQINLTSLL